MGMDLDPLERIPPLRTDSDTRAIPFIAKDTNFIKLSLDSISEITGAACRLQDNLTATQAECTKLRLRNRQLMELLVRLPFVASRAAPPPGFWPCASVKDGYELGCSQAAKAVEEVLNEFIEKD